MYDVIRVNTEVGIEVPEKKQKLKYFRMNSGKRKSRKIKGDFMIKNGRGRGKKVEKRARAKARNKNK